MQECGLAFVVRVLYLHDSNTHLFSLSVALKFLCALQLGSNPKLAFNVPYVISFNASTSWISKSMEHQGFLLPQLRALNKTPTARYVLSCLLQLRPRIGVKWCQAADV